MHRHRGYGRLVAIIVAVVAADARAQLADRLSMVSPFGLRYDAFRLVCGDESLLALPLGTVEEFRASDRPDEWLVISLGDVDALSRLVPDPARFLEAGGSMLVATDRATDYLENAAGVRIESGPAMVPRGVEAYLDLPNCPIVRRLHDSHPVFDGAAELVLNNAGFLSGPGAVAWLPNASFRGEQEVGAAPVVATTEGAGRLIIVSDQSVFTNEMIREGDNLRIARNMANWLIADRPASQLKTLFLEDGQAPDEWVDERFEQGEWPLFDSETLLALLNEMAAELQRGDVFNSLIANMQQSINARALRRILIFAFSLALMLLLCRWLLKARQPTETPAAVESPTGTLDSRRRKEILENRSFLEPARQLCRHFFVSNLGPLDWKADRIETHQDASWLVRWKTMKAVRQAWAVADGTLSHPISHARFLRIAEEITLLETELKHGTLRLSIRAGER